jgi:hypothetical protein
VARRDLQNLPSWSGDEVLEVVLELFAEAVSKFRWAEAEEAIELAERAAHWVEHA